MIKPKHSTNVNSYVRTHGVAQLLLWSGFYYLLPALSAQISAQTGWRVLHISMTYTAAFVLWAITAPVVGTLIDAGQGIKVMRIGAAVGVALLLALSLTSNMWIFSFLVACLGLCMAATLYDPCFSIMLRHLDSNGSQAVATVTLIAGFATLVTFPLVIGLSTFMGWQHIVQVFAGVAAVGMFLLPHDKPTAAVPSRMTTKMPLDRGPILIALSFGLVMMGHSILVFLLPVALTDVGNNTNAALLALAILGPAQIAGRTAWRYFGTAVRPQDCALIMFGCLCLPAIILLSIGTAPFAIYTALIIQGACYGVHTILRPNLAQCYVAPSQLGRGLGLIAMVGLLMMAVGPAVGGLIWTLTGISGLLCSLLLLNGLALVLGLILRGETLMEANL